EAFGAQVDRVVVLETGADVVDAAELGYGTVAVVDPVAQLVVRRGPLQDRPVGAGDVAQGPQLAPVVQAVGVVGVAERGAPGRHGDLRGSGGGGVGVLAVVGRVGDGRRVLDEGDRGVVG